MTLPGLVTAIPEPKPISRISPSRFHSLKECALREAWASANSGLLPVNAIARLGSIAHRVLEEVGLGKLASETAIATRWDELVADTHKAMEREWLERHLVPLNRSVGDYEVRRLRCIRHAARLLESSARGKKESEQKKQLQEIQYEFWVQTPDGEVGGRIDYVYRDANGIVVRDYKTGVITDEESETGTIQIKAEYQTQLMLYAALYNASTGEWPRHIEIVPLSGTTVRLDVQPEICKAILTEALAVLKHMNEIVSEVKSSGISVMLDLVKPSPTICRYCTFRPWCPLYENARKHDDENQKWPRDVIGISKQIILLGNGTSAINVQEANRAESTWVRGLTNDQVRHPAISQLTVGCRLGLFNLGAGAGGSFTETQYTVIYRMNLD